MLLRQQRPKTRGLRNRMPNRVPAHFLPEDGDRAVFKRAVLNTVIGDVRQAIKCGLIKAGFTDVQVSKIIHHPVYEISLRRGSTMASDSDAQVQRRIRQALKREGLYENSKKTMLLISVYRQRIVCGFHAAGHDWPQPGEPAPDEAMVEWP